MIDNSLIHQFVSFHSKFMEANGANKAGIAKVSEQKSSMAVLCDFLFFYPFRLFLLQSGSLENLDIILTTST